MKRIHAVENSSSVDLKCQFREFADEISALGAKAGVRITPYREESVPHFARQSEDKQLNIVNELATYVRICHATLSAGGKLDDSTVFTWNALKEFKLRPPSDLFNYIAEDNVIEIHTKEGIQIFRNFRFYECCSYSLEELACFPWNVLYRRNESAFMALMGAVQRMMSGAVRETIPLEGLGRHLIEEAHSPYKYKIDAEMNYGAPLFDEDNVPVATIVIERGKVMGGPLTTAEETELLKRYRSEQIFPSV